MKNITLIKIGAIGGIITCTMGFVYQNKVNRNIKQTIFFKESMNLVRHHKAAVHFLGEPIKDCTIDILNNSNSYIADTTGKYEVKLKGSKQNGKLYIYINKKNNDVSSDWNLSYLELALDNQPDKRLLIRPTMQNDDLPLNLV